MLILHNQTFHQYRLGSIVFEELFHLCWQLSRVVASDGVDTHRVGELDEVGVRHAGVRVAGVVEKVLINREKEV